MWNDINVKAPCGNTEEFKLSQLVLQGSVFGPINCWCQIDTIERDCLEQDGHSKYKILVKAKVEREKYFDDPRFSRNNAQLLFCPRTRILDFKMNFSNKYDDDISFKICHVQVECQEHILKCEPLKDNIEVPNNVVYLDIFTNSDTQLEAMKLIKKIFRER